VEVKALLAKNAGNGSSDGQKPGGLTYAVLTTAGSFSALRHGDSETSPTDVVEMLEALMAANELLGGTPCFKGSKEMSYLWIGMHPKAMRR
jgi:hypothetical protein